MPPTPDQLTFPRVPRPSRALTRATRGLAAIALCVASATAGVGWVYLLRHAGALDAGPRSGGALPLQRLAHGDAQPLLRMLVAWVPAGLVAGAALARLTALRRGTRAVVASLVTLVVLGATGSIGDAVTANDPLTSHVSAQPRHAGLWLAVGLMAAGAVIAPFPRRLRGRRPACPTDATRSAGAGRVAA